MAMKVLQLKMKHGDYFVAARDEEEEGRAWLHLFAIMNGNGYYDQITEEEDADQFKSMTLARLGVASAAKRLLELRNGFAYEWIEIIYPVTP